MERMVMLGATVCGRCVEEHCVVVQSIEGCGKGSCCEGRVCVNNIVGSVIVTSRRVGADKEWWRVRDVSVHLVQGLRKAWY